MISLIHKRVFYLVLIVFIVLLLAVLVLLLYPGNENAVPVLGGSINEFAAFAILACLVSAVFQMKIPSVFLLALGLGMVAGCYELAQVWTPYREAIFADWLSNLVAIFAGCLVGWQLGKVEASLLSNSEA